MKKYFSMAKILLDDATRCMDLYESGRDFSQSRLVLARVQIDAAQERGANIDSELLRLVNLYRNLPDNDFKNN